MNTKVCENCSSLHNGSYGSGRFCCEKCSRAFSTKAKRKEINAKVSKTLKQKLLNGERIGFCKIENRYDKNGNRIKYKLKCKKCNKIFYTLKKKQKYCSISCGAQINGWRSVHKVLTKSDWSRINKKAYKDGKNYIAGGTTKWYNYKNIRVQGTYELRTCYILDKWKEIGKIKDWEYTKDRIKYIGIDKKEHSYLLDFKIFNNDGSWYYLETKGWKKENDELKWKETRNQGYKLIIWFKDDIKKEENKTRV